MDDIESYEPKYSQILEVDDGWIEAFFAEEVPEHGEAIALEPPGDLEEPVYATVRSHQGSRRVRAMLADRPDWLAEGLSVRRTHEPTHVRWPSDGRLQLDARSFVPGASGDDENRTHPLHGERPSFSELDGRCEALSIGWEPLDLFAPVVRGGVHLVIDASEDDTLFERLQRTARSAFDVDAFVRVESTSDPSGPREEATHMVRPSSGRHGRFVALRVGTEMAAHLREQGRDVAVTAELPVPQSSPRRASSEPSADPEALSFSELVDRVATPLVSTDRGSVTSFIRLPLRDAPVGLETIIETLDLGDVDAQILFDEEGRFRPRRSASDGELDETRRKRRESLLREMRRADQLRDKREIMGEIALTDEEQALLERVDERREAYVWGT